MAAACCLLSPLTTTMGWILRGAEVITQLTGKINTNLQAMLRLIIFIFMAHSLFNLLTCSMNVSLWILFAQFLVYQMTVVWMFLCEFCFPGFSLSSNYCGLLSLLIQHLQCTTLNLLNVIWHIWKRRICPRACTRCTLAFWWVDPGRVGRVGASSCSLPSPPVHLVGSHGINLILDLHTVVYYNVDNFSVEVKAHAAGPFRCMAFIYLPHSLYTAYLSISLKKKKKKKKKNVSVHSLLLPMNHVTFLFITKISKWIFCRKCSLNLLTIVFLIFFYLTSIYHHFVALFLLKTLLLD